MRRADSAAPLDVHVVDGEIGAVGQNLSAGDAVSLDASGLWLLPGIFDCHDHLSMSTLALAESLATPLSLWALETAQNARVTLEAGVTFVRDMAGADAGMRDAVARGLVPGPTMQISTVLISQTGGHGDGFLAGPGFELSPANLMPNYPGKPRFVVDGAEEMRKAVREVIRAGADWIKLATTGGLVSDHDHPLVADFTLAEVEAAGRRGETKGQAGRGARLRRRRARQRSRGRRHARSSTAASSPRSRHSAWRRPAAGSCRRSRP